MNDIDQEIAFHLEALTRELMAGGMSESDVRAEAVRRFGDVGEVRRAMLRPRLFTALTLLALTLASTMHRLLWFIPAYRIAHSEYPFYFAESFKNLCEVGVCCVALLLMRQKIAAATGIDSRLPGAIGFAAASAWPMFIGFALTRSTHVADWLAVGYLAFFSPFVEEFIVRGFALRSLRRIGWPLWPAALLIALVGGLTHIEKGQRPSEILAIFAVVALGNCTFCWIIERWQSLWFAFALHAAMNFSWELFNVGNTVIGGWYAFVLQNGSVLLAILITLRFTSKSNRLQTIGQNRLSDRRELHIRRSLVDLSDLRVAPELLDRILLRVPVAAKELDRGRGDVLADFR